MLDIVICAHDVTELQQLTQLVIRYSRRRNDLLVNIRRFQSLFDLVDAISMGSEFQICLLDHRERQDWMNRWTAEYILRQAAPETAIIGFTDNVEAVFHTPHPQDSLKLEAVLLKPISSMELYRVLDRVAEQRLPRAADPALELPTPEGARSLPFRQLIRAHYRAHVVRCHLTDGQVVKSSVLRLPFNQVIQPLLQTGKFCWISASCVVNLAFVEELDKAASTVRLMGGEVLPVPKAGFPGLKENLQKYRESPPG